MIADPADFFDGIVPGERKNHTGTPQLLQSRPLCYGVAPFADSSTLYLPRPADATLDDSATL